jgi:Domain of unknown function (DUF1918)
MKAQAGDRLVVHAHHVGERGRDAEIVEVLGEDGGPPYRVVWQDTGTQSIFFPSSDAHVEHFEKAGSARPKRGSRAKG